MPYTRPDSEATKAALLELAARLRAAASYEEARSVYLEQDEETRHLDTLSVLASLRHSIDTRGTFYDAEMDWWNGFGPELEAPRQAWTQALLESPFRPQFEAEFGDLLFRNAEIKLRTFSEQLVPDMQAKNRLVTEYAKLIASAQIPFQSET